MNLVIRLDTRNVQIFGLVTLVVALIELGSFVGIGHQDTNPFNTYSYLQFGFGLSFVLAHILASIGIWMRAFWGLLVFIMSIVSETLLLIIWPNSASMGFSGLTIHLIFLVVLLALTIQSRPNVQRLLDF